MPKPLYRLGDAKGHRYCTLCRKDVKAGAPATAHALWHVSRHEVTQLKEAGGMIVRFEVVEARATPTATPKAKPAA
jgi:hypothetical protein